MLTWRSIIVLLVGLCAGSALAGAGQTAFRVQLRNQSPHTIEAAYVSLSSGSGWGENLLPRSPLAPQKRVTVTVPGGCGVYDLRFVTRGGVELVDEEVRLCSDDVVSVESERIRRIQAPKPPAK